MQKLKWINLLAVLDRSVLPRLCALANPSTQIHPNVPGLDLALVLSPQSDLQGAFELLNEAANLFQNVHGAMSKEVAQCCKLLAVVLFHAEDFGGAIAQGHKELILNERILGLDHPDTIHRLGIFLRTVRNTK